MSIGSHDGDGDAAEVDAQGRRKRRRGRAGAKAGGVTARRLYCVIGSDNGFVQAWEVSLDGEKGVGGQPLWSQKVRGV